MVLVQRMSDLERLAERLLLLSTPKQQPTHRRIRALFNRKYVLDSKSNAQYVWEHEYYPQFYIPYTDFMEGVFHRRQDIIDGRAWLGSLRCGDRPPTEVLGFEYGPLKNLVRVSFDAMDTWFQEDEPCYIHPKDPTKRIDTLPSTRHIRIALSGHTLASSNNVITLIEPLLPVRYYLPKTSVDWEVMRDSETRTGCPYKGEAEYYHVAPEGQTESKDLAWWYRYPVTEVGAIAGRVCFYNEKVDVFVDGVEQERPVTKFS